MFMASLILLCSINLLSQEALGDCIYVAFSGLNCGMNEECAEFISDYSQYQLCFTFWVGIHGYPYCGMAYLMYNTTTIERDELILILQNDYRIYNVYEEDDQFRPRELAIKLYDSTTESDLLASYAEYGLYGSVPSDFYHPIQEVRSYLFNDTLIYPGDLARILNDDHRVEFAYFAIYLQQGRLYYSLHEWVTDEIRIEFQNDYPYIEFVGLGLAQFNFLEYNEFFVRDQFNRDERVLSVRFSGYGWPPNVFICPPPTLPTTDTDVVEEKIKSSNIVSIYPNPFNPSTTIVYNMRERENIILQVYNIKGQLVQTLINGVKEPGNHSVVWNGIDNNNRAVSSGVYFLILETDSTKESKKILLMK